MTAFRPAIVALALAAGAATLTVQAQQPVTYSAQAVNLDAPAGAATTLVQIQIRRWSTDAERDRLTTALLEKGMGQLFDELSKMKPVGFIRTPDSVGYDLRYARQSKGAGGSEHVFILTDRPISFAERRAIARSTEYPFTVIDLQLNSNGQGKGSIAIAAKIMADKATGTLAVETYSVQPIQLQNVRQE